MSIIVATTDLIAALPALPLGRGALILILGGMFMLALSLAWSLLLPRDGSWAAANQPWLPVMAPGRDPLAPWMVAVRSATQRHGYGDARILDAAADRCKVVLEGCRSCRAARPTGRCNAEARVLFRAVRPHARRARVHEIQCHLRQSGPCIFEIRLGGR